MKITCLKRHLQKAGLLCEKITNNNPTLPILSAVLITTKNNSVDFLSTNLEMSLKISIPAKIEKEGKVAIPSKLFSGLISSFPKDEEVKLNTLNNNLIISTHNSSTTIKGYNIEDFPIIPEVKNKKTFTISVEDFLAGLKSVYYSASISEMKPEINSIYLFGSKNNPLTFVATDTARLSEKLIHYTFSDSVNILIPYRSVVEILRIFEGRDGDLDIKIDDNNLVLISNGVEFISRLIDGNYPDYKQIIPKNFTNTITIEKKNITDALKTSSMFCGKLNDVKLKIYENEKFIELQTNNPDLGEHNVSIESEVNGGDLSLVFNHKYLTDCLNSLNSEKIILKFTGEGKPLLITCLDDKSFKYLIMPMKNI